MPSTSWEKTKGYSKKGFDKAWHAFDKLGAPVNRLSYRVGSEAFWPMELEKENEKAARILRSFCNDGFYANDDDTINGADGKINQPKGKQRVLQKIPAKVIQRAKGLAIFTTMRTGLWLSGSGGSGVLMARIPETGEWSPPSGIMLHTAGVGFLAGVDIYDCVVVINTYEALEAFKQIRCTVGSEVSASAGPVGVGGVLESEIHKRQAPIWTYMKSRGLYAGVQIDGTVIIERTDANERFYGQRISVGDILAGKGFYPPASIKTLIHTVKAVQGDKDVDTTAVPPPGETPGDYELQPSNGAFGIPAADDPDPFGVKALEAQGCLIREAGTKSRPKHDTFEFRPTSGSPIYATFARRSLDSSPRTSWRASGQSYASINRGTQTDEATVPTSVSRASSRSIKNSADRIDNRSDGEDNRGDNISLHGQGHSPLGHGQDHDDYDSDRYSVDDADLEVHEVSSATVSKRESFANTSPISLEDPTAPPELKRQSPTFIRPRLVTIPKRPLPPALPPRHPQRLHSSTPISPVSSSSPIDDTRSVASSSGRAAMNGFAELPLNLNISTSNISSRQPSPEKEKDDEFHSVSSAQPSDFEDNKEETSTATTHDENETKETNQEQEHPGLSNNPFIGLAV